MKTQTILEVALEDQDSLTIEVLPHCLRVVDIQSRLAEAWRSRITERLQRPLKIDEAQARMNEIRVLPRRAGSSLPGSLARGVSLALFLNERHDQLPFWTATVMSIDTRVDFV